MVNYEGGLLSVSNRTPSTEKNWLDKECFTTQLGFRASEGALNTVSGSGSLIAVGGTQEVIHLYDTATKRSCGELYGHQGAITSLAFSPGATLR